MINKKIEKDDLITEIVYNSNKLICNEKVVTMNNSVLTSFFSKLTNFYKYAPKEVVEAFCNEFIPQFTEVLKEYDEEKMLALLDEWFDTIDIYGNPETVSRIDNVEIDMEKGLYIEWNPNQNID